MERYFGTDFSEVRVHVGHEAKSIGALAFTAGSDIYFSPEQYRPGTRAGQELLGHELTHVVQQREGRVANPLGDGVAVVQDFALEAEADWHGKAVAQGHMGPRAGPGSSAQSKRGRLKSMGHEFGDPRDEPSHREAVQAKPLYSRGAAQPLIKRASTPYGRGSSVAVQPSTKGFSKCDAIVISSSTRGEGSYQKSIHGEINALEAYLGADGKIGDITQIQISSPPCKYCHVILSDLGIRDKVVCEGTGFGSCQGGSYGWFWSEENVSKAVQVASGLSEKDYIDRVVERVKELK